MQIVQQENTMRNGALFDRIADRWQGKADNSREYDVIRDGNIFATSFTDTFLFQSEFERANMLKSKLLERWSGYELGDVFEGKEIETPVGSCFAITSHEQLFFEEYDAGKMREKIFQDLKLIYGIGEQTERSLKARGYQTIHDLLQHSRYRNSARSLIRLMEQGNTADIIQWMSRWYPASHPAILRTTLFHRREDFVFFDIETLGLFSRPIILLGIGRFEGENFVVSQYLLRDIAEEEAALSATLNHFRTENTALVTFNGRSFDMPYLLDRIAYYGLNVFPSLPHYDMLHFSRRRWKNHLPDCRLQTLERHICGVKREEDVPSSMVPEFYETYVKMQNPGPLLPIVEHNRMDLVTLARIFSRLREWCNASI
jgi:uncharacterized protein YprB with RNaseH-like and TPR domain